MLFFLQKPPTKTQNVYMKYIPEFDTLKVRKTKKKLAGDCCSGDFQPTNFFWVCNVF